jgi:general L-amino acid transport system permease protein
LEFKFPLILGALFALAAPSFGGARAARLRYIGVWLGALGLLIMSFRLGAASSLLELSGTAFVGGLSLTFTLAIAAIVLSFPLGVLLALGRASTMPIVRMISTTYIELVRSVPLITWLYIGSNLLNLFLAGVVDIFSVVRAITAMTLFSAAYLAENVRGGLQSIPKGQYEAADAVGMSVVQKTVLITLPQALKAVIPALVGQVISLFKDTSLVSIIGLFDLLYIARNVIPGQSANIGSILELTVVAAAIYWIFTFTFSRSSMRLERRLGLGTR